jgi:hypothetical protein
VGVQPTNESLIKLLELVLTKNNFQFNGQNYLQIGGTAMGTKLAPGYAINSMGKFEQRYVYTYHKQPLLFLRYIDDIFIIWTHGRESLMEFIEYLNQCSESIKFTHEISDKSVPFLDTLVSLDEGKIKTDLYSKPTDSHSYLKYESAHPQRCKDSIPFSQFLRVRRICSDIEDFDRHIICLSAYFIKQGYPVDLLLEAAFKARALDRNELLSITHTKDTKNLDSDSVFLISTYHPHEQSMKDMIHKNWDFLGKSQTTDFLYKKHVMCGYRRPKNLRDILMNAKVPVKPGDERADANHQLLVPAPTVETVTLSSNSANVQKSITDFFKPVVGDTTSPSDPSTSTMMAPNLTATILKKDTLPTPGPSKFRGFNFCNRRDCRYCPLLNKTGKITCHVTETEHNCMKNISCRSSNLIYAITCTRCGIQYVGQTMLRIKDRFVHHFHDIITCNLDKNVSKHFA